MNPSYTQREVAFSEMHRQELLDEATVFAQFSQAIPGINPGWLGFDAHRARERRFPVTPFILLALLLVVLATQLG